MLAVWDGWIYENDNKIYEEIRGGSYYSIGQENKQENMGESVGFYFL